MFKTKSVSFNIDQGETILNVDGKRMILHFKGFFGGHVENHPK